MPRKKGRSKSDALYHLARSFGSGMYGKLKAYNEVYFNETTKQWRLIDYYREMQGPWSKEREDEDWKGENLAVLKSRTFRWLIRAMGKVGDWPNHDLHDLIGEISLAIANDRNGEAMDFIDEVKALVISREQYGLLPEILRLERRAIETECEGEERDTLLEANMGLLNEANSRVAEIARMEKLRLRCFEPIKRSGAQEGNFAKADIDRMEAALAEINVATLRTAAARLEWHSMTFSLYVAKAELELAHKHAQRWIGIYRENPWLAGQDFARYLKHLMYAALVATEVGDRKAAYKVFAEFAALDWTDPAIQTKATEQYVRLHLIIGSKWSNPDLVREGLMLFRDWEAEIVAHTPRLRMIWLYFNVGKSAMALQEWKLAIRSLSRLIDMKSQLRRDVLIHARVMLVLCNFSIGQDPAYVESLSIAASKFLHRQPGDHGLFIAIVRWVGSMARNIHDKAIVGKIADEAIATLAKADSPNRLWPDWYLGYLDWFRRVVGIYIPSMTSSTMESPIAETL